jgi:hypothetical protein
MDAVREGHSEIAQMLRDAGGSEVSASGQPASQHKVRSRRPPPAAHMFARFLMRSLQGATSVSIAGYGSVDLASELRKRKL